MPEVVGAPDRCEDSKVGLRVGGERVGSRQAGRRQGHPRTGRQAQAGGCITSRSARTPGGPAGSAAPMSRERVREEFICPALSRFHPVVWQRRCGSRLREGTLPAQAL
jgi:hypothetical protein